MFHKLSKESRWFLAQLIETGHSSFKMPQLGAIACESLSLHHVRQFIYSFPNILKHLPEINILLLNLAIEIITLLARECRAVVGRIAKIVFP